MVKALHHFMFVKPSTLHYPCIIHRQNQCHKYRQNHPFPMIFPWGFIGNGRNVSICSPVARRGSTADRVDWQTRQTSQPICRTHGQAQQTTFQKLGRQLGVSWSSPARGIRLPGTSPPLLHRQLLPHRRRHPLPRLWCSPGRLGLNITNAPQQRHR